MDRPSKGSSIHEKIIRDFLRFLKSKRYLHHSYYYDLKYRLIVELYSGKSFNFAVLENLNSKVIARVKTGFGCIENMRGVED